MVIDKCINHIKWLLNALKEHNKIIRQDIKNKLNDKNFSYNKAYVCFYMGFSNYSKLIDNLDKSFQILISNGTLSYSNLNKTCNIYLNRSCIVFKESGQNLKMARQDLSSLSNSFVLSFNEMKQISNLLSILQKNLILLNNYLRNLI